MNYDNNTNYSKKSKNELIIENKLLKEELSQIRKKNKQSNKRKLWLTKKFGSFFIGPNLKQSIKNVINEFNNTNKISLDTIADLTSNLIKRLTRISTFAIIVAVIPLFLLYQQNNLLKRQNEKLDKQTILFENQNILLDTQNNNLEKQINLSEADRRSSQMFIMGEVLSDINKELESVENPNRLISNTLIGRIISVSRAMKPYKYLENGQLTINAISPERGQLLVTLISSRIDSITLNRKIIRKCDFSYSDLKNADLSYSDLSGTDLSFSDLSNANLFNSVLKQTNFDNSVCSNSNLQYSNISGASFINTNLSYSNIQNSIAIGATFKNANMQSANLCDSNLKNANLNSTNLLNTQFVFTNLNNARMNDVRLNNHDFNITNAISIDRLHVNRKDWFNYLDSLNIEGVERLRNKYRIKKNGSIYEVINKSN